MYAAAVLVELHLPGLQSLKEKRSLLRSTIAGLRGLGSLSVSEVDHQDSWQRSRIGIALVCARFSDLEAMMQQARRFLTKNQRLVLLEFLPSYLEDPNR